MDFRSTYSINILVTAFLYFQFINISSAESPPDLPLPACIEKNGVKIGPCEPDNQFVTSQISGKLAEKTTLSSNVAPTIPVCDKSFGYPPYDWNPSPCYSAVHRPAVFACGYIDLLDGNKWKEKSCISALYLDRKSAPQPLFSVTGQGDGGICGGRGNYYTYIWGGPANEPGKKWAEFGPARRNCNLTFNGPRPDGLYGPTWVKVRVGIDKAENGNERRGYPEYAYAYVPIDGDLRETTIDVELIVSAKVDKSKDPWKVTYTVTATNKGTKDADNVEVTITLPEQLHFFKVNNSNCQQSGSAPFYGGSVLCTGINLAKTGNKLGNDVAFIDIETLVLNASDFTKPVVAKAKVADDKNLANNEAISKVEMNLKSGSASQTRVAMESIDKLFNYETPDALLGKQCNEYMDDIFKRLNVLRTQNPEAFADLAFGRVTSGDYYWAPAQNRLTRAGHVGVVVYPKGTNYHETGIIIHGTPTWSPSDLDLETQIGKKALGDHVNSLDFAANVVQQGTQSHGLYYRTPIKNFPGSPTVELPLACGFEGVYDDNQAVFARPAPKSCITSAPKTCPILPDAVLVRTQSPVNIQAINSKGQKVITDAGRIAAQELDTGIHSYSMKHEDGSYGWLLVLPKDSYDINLEGTAEGSYTLTTIKFDKDKKVVEDVNTGSTVKGLKESFSVKVSESEEPKSTEKSKKSSGGGSVSLGLMMSLLYLIFIANRRKR